MHILGLRSIIRRAKGYCTKTSFVNVEDNILNRNFTATAPNQKWCTDVKKEESKCEDEDINYM